MYGNKVLAPSARSSALGFGSYAPHGLSGEACVPAPGQHPAAVVYSLLAGSEDVNDAERLCHGPTFRLVGSDWLRDRGAATASRLHSFKTEMPGEEEIFMSLSHLNGVLLGRADAMDSTYRDVLDMDSTEVPVYGETEQGA
jgi:hypothetical protein